MGNQQERVLKKIATTYNGKEITESILVTEHGEVYRVKDGEPIAIAQHVDKIGYPKVQLVVKGKRKTVMVHRLLAQTFLDNPDNKETVNHKDSNRSNNNISNLEWNTYSENNKHAYDHGLQVKKIGEQVHNSSLTNEQALEMYNKMLSGSTARELSNEFGLDVSVLTQLGRKASYRELTKDLPDVEIRRVSFKVDDELAEIICKMLQGGNTSMNILLYLHKYDGLKIHHIKDIKRKKTFTHISCKYTF